MTFILSTVPHTCHTPKGADALAILAAHTSCVPCAAAPRRHRAKLTARAAKPIVEALLLEAEETLDQVASGRRPALARGYLTHAAQQINAALEVVGVIDRPDSDRHDAPLRGLHAQLAAAHRAALARFNEAVAAVEARDAATNEAKERTS